MMDREQIRARWEALKSAWAALNGPEAFPGEHFAHEDDVQDALEAVENDVDDLLAAIDRVLALHKPYTLQLLAPDCSNEDCEHEDGCPSVDFQVCGLCYHAEVLDDERNFQESERWPCETVRAVEA